MFRTEDHCSNTSNKASKNIAVDDCATAAAVAAVRKNVNDDDDHCAPELPCLAYVPPPPAPPQALRPTSIVYDCIPRAHQSSFRSSDDDNDDDDVLTTTQNIRLLPPQPPGGTALPGNFLTMTPKEPIFSLNDINDTDTYNREHMSILTPFVVDTLVGTISSHASIRAGLVATTIADTSGYEMPSGQLDSASLTRYLQSMTEGSYASTATFIGALVLLDRICMRKAAQGEAFLLSYANVYGVFVGCARVASKVLELRIVNNKHWAAAARVKLETVNRLESLVLQDLAFDVCVHRADWEHYASRIVGPEAFVSDRRRTSFPFPSHDGTFDEEHEGSRGAPPPPPPPQEAAAVAASSAFAGETF